MFRRKCINRGWYVSFTKGECKTKILIILGGVWVGICLIILWLNHRFPRRHIVRRDRRRSKPHDYDKIERRKNVEKQLINEDGTKIVTTNLSVSPRTGEITSPKGVVELESYQRSKTGKTTQTPPPDQDSVDE